MSEFECNQKTDRFVAISPNILTHPVVGAHIAPPKPRDETRVAITPLAAWLDLIFAAAWKPHNVTHRKHSITLQRGDLLGSRDYWSKKWNWGVKAVRCFFERLERASMIAKKGQQYGHAPTVLTICNYDKHQTLKQRARPDEGPTSDLERAIKGPVRGQQGASKGPYSTREYQDNTNKIPSKRQRVRAQESESASGDAPPPDSDLKNLDSLNPKIDAARHAKSLSVNQQTFEMCVQVHGEKTTSEALLRLASRIHDGQKIAKPSVLLPRICEDVAKEPRKTHYPSLATLHGVKLPNGRILSRFG